MAGRPDGAVSSVRTSEGDNFEIAFDGANGRIRRALIDRHSVLYGRRSCMCCRSRPRSTNFPSLKPGGSPSHSISIPPGDDYEVVETGTYRDFAGELRFRITPQGGIRSTTNSPTREPILRAREVGLQFGVPLWCDKLQWRRRGEWTVYPDDHIGRNDGIAMAHAPGPQTVPPTQPFALDDTPIGTNDFRSTKRNFVYASLTGKEGYGIGIEAIGPQHLRAIGGYGLDRGQR